MPPYFQRFSAIAWQSFRDPPNLAAQMLQFLQVSTTMKIVHLRCMNGDWRLGGLRTYRERAMMFFDRWCIHCWWEAISDFESLGGPLVEN